MMFYNCTFVSTTTFTSVLIHNLKSIERFVMQNKLSPGQKGARAPELVGDRGPKGEPGLRGPTGSTGGPGRKGDPGLCYHVLFIIM